MTGRVILMGSGELAPRLVSAHRRGLELADTRSVTVLDTPYGFQENADQLTSRIVEFFETSLSAAVTVASLRSRHEDAASRERFLRDVAKSRYVFAGPGSPSYALGIWRELGLGDALAGVVANGGTVGFASAAALTIGVATIPVYEIYKVGAEPFWLDGLNILGAFGLECAVVPHWNNAEGGTHDTSRCYIGRHRLETLIAQRDVAVLGIDEHTAAMLDFDAGTLSVGGLGTVTFAGSQTESRVIPTGEEVDLRAAITETQQPPATSRPPAPPALEHASEADRLLNEILDAEATAANDPTTRQTFRSLLVDIAEAAAEGARDTTVEIRGFVELLLEIRRSLRDAGRFDEADLIRDRLVGLGVELRDGPEGTEWFFDPPAR